jgi:Arylsulfotransferase (ASST).
MGHPRIHPTGVTLYNKKKAYSGYTVFPSAKGALLIDMEGNEVQLWAGLSGFPNKILPGGYVLGSTGERNPKYGFQDELDLVQVDWEGNIVWKFDQTEYIEDPGEKPRYIARQHHDYQREGSSTGYYAPGSEPLVNGGKTLILTHENASNPKITDKPLLDDKIIEVTWDGKILWEWPANEHFDELGFDETAKKVIYQNPSQGLTVGGTGDWLHINSISTLGPNKWYDAEDERFDPDNIIWSSRNANIIAIISKKTGKLVWRLGPNFSGTEAERKLGWIVGQHHPHLIPKGLPGEGNLLIFDNGGWAGYGQPNGTSPDGVQNERREYSRVIELNPVTLRVEWEYTAAAAGFFQYENFRFYSPYVSSAQRLPNGNTLITEGSDGRIFEVTPKNKTVWEYINPYYQAVKGYAVNMVYRAYRVPYEWIPQLKKPAEKSIPPLNVRTFRIPGAALDDETNTVHVEGTDPDRLQALENATLNADFDA